MRGSIILFLFLARATSGIAMEEDSLRSAVARDQGMIDLLLECMAGTYTEQDLSGDLLYVSVERQRLYHVHRGRIQAVYPVSTSARGIGSMRESLRTPQGLHRVVEKLGEGTPAWGIFQERIYTGEQADRTTTGNKDQITTRILWLDGLEPGLNRGGAVDSHDRHIYIHGTAEEELIGTPASRGCVRMRNADVLQLYDEVRTGALVLILP